MHCANVEGAEDICYSIFFALVQCPCNTDTLNVILWSWSSLFGYLTGAMYVILCSRFSLPPLQSTPAQCVLSYVPAIVSWDVNTDIMYVILCSWSSLPVCNPGAMYVIVCFWVSLPCPIHQHTRYALLWSCSSTMPLQHWRIVCCSMLLILLVVQ